MPPAACQVEQLEVRPAVGDVTTDVLLELEPVDDDRRDRFLFLRLRFRFTRIGVVRHKHDVFGVGRPGKVIDASFFLRQLFRLATGAGKNPELVVLNLILATRKEGEPLAIRTPARMCLVIVTESKGAIF